ncbi:MAG TPA: TetR/AcrR family transcriptional regulator [Leptospiraceae bacterium]|nr:TetR/AcrR family transcriptional regulator [Leptospiraceae bacterium]
MKKNSNTKERIMEVAVQLFYENGYSETGINEILEKSSTFKKSFYTYFSSKTELGIFYIKHMEKELLSLSEKLLTKYPKFEEFISAWLKIMKYKFSKNYSFGCPLVNMPINSSEINSEVRLAFENLKGPFRKYFKDNYGLSSAQSIELGEEILFLYEGAINSYKLDPRQRYFDYMERYLNSIALRLKNLTR